MIYTSTIRRSVSASQGTCQPYRPRSPNAGVESLCCPASGPRAWRPCGPGRVATGHEGCCLSAVQRASTATSSHSTGSPRTPAPFWPATQALDHGPAVDYGSEGRVAAEAVTIAYFGARRSWSGRSTPSPSFVGTRHRVTLVEVDRKLTTTVTTTSATTGARRQGGTHRRPRLGSSVPGQPSRLKSRRSLWADAAPVGSWPIAKQIDFADDPDAPKANSLVLPVNDNWAIACGAIGLGEFMPLAAIRKTIKETGMHCEVTGTSGACSNPRNVNFYTSSGDAKHSPLFSPPALKPANPPGRYYSRLASSRSVVGARCAVSIRSYL